MDRKTFNLRESLFFLLGMLLVLVASDMAPVKQAHAADVYSSQSDQSMAKSEIANDALSSVSGVVAVNQATGDSNAQANSRAIAISQSGGVAIAYVMSAQRVDGNVMSMPDVAISRIAGNAFSHAQGMLSINQSAGVGNMQLNAFVLSGSIDGELTDEMLSETLTGASATTGEAGSGSNTQRNAEVNRTAFIGTSGIVQLNQVAGSGNVTRNRFEMSFNPNH